jgi:hypothetical protein
MKTLKDYLLTESENYLSEITMYTVSFVDYLYNEGVVAYDDKHLKAIKHKKTEPDYIDICNGILHEGYKISDKTKTELKKYIKNQSSKEIENAIMQGILQFCQDAYIR